MCQPSKDNKEEVIVENTNISNNDKKILYNMPKMSLFKEFIACISLGILCGYYFIFILVLVPLLIYGCFCSIYIKSISGVIILLLFTFSLTPLNHKPWNYLLKSQLFSIWREYFDYKLDASAINGNKKLDSNGKYVFAEFPHGTFPVAQVVSASVMDEINGEGKTICGLGADAIFVFPGMRQFMSWLGVHTANRKNITKILNNYGRCAIIPGGIAEMYLINDKTEEIYLKERKGFIKAAIQEGAGIIPCYFFGNTTLFTIIGGSGSTDSFLAKISRSLKASIMFFYGRYFLPIPYRKPLHMICGEVIEVNKIDNPTNEDIDNVMTRLQIAVQKLYDEKRPSWETRPLIIK